MRPSNNRHVVRSVSPFGRIACFTAASQVVVMKTSSSGDTNNSTGVTVPSSWFVVTVTTILVAASIRILLPALKQLLLKPKTTSSRRQRDDAKVFGKPVLPNGRRLGLLERWFVANTRAGVHTGFIVAVEFTTTATHIRNMNMTNKDNVMDALTRVSQRFPWLRTRLYHQNVEMQQQQQQLWGDDLHVQVHDSADLVPFGFRQVVQMSLSEILNEEMNSGWDDQDPTMPLWRVTMIHSSDGLEVTLVLAFHHLITDGIGAMAVVQALLEEGGTTTTDFKVAQRNTLAPPLEDLVDTVPRVRHLFMPVLLDRFPMLIPYLKPPCWKGMQLHHSDTAATTILDPIMKEMQMVCLNIVPFEELQQLDQYCKTNKLSTNAILMATLIKAIVKVEENHTGLRFHIVTAADERRRRCHLPPSSALGNYITAPHMTLQLPVSSTIDYMSSPNMARVYQSKLQHSLQTSLMDIGLTRFIVNDWVEFVKQSCRHSFSTLSNNITYSLESSNLGMQVFDPKASANWKVTNIWFAQGRRGTGCAIEVKMVGGPQGYNACMSAFPCAVTKETLIKIGDAWRNEIDCLYIV